MRKQKRKHCINHKRNILSPGLKKNLLVMLTKFSFFAFIFLFGCQYNEEEHPREHFPIESISSSDREWLCDFVEDFFLHSPAIYTLFGTKPMSGITLDLSTKAELLEELKPEFEVLTEKERANKLKEIENYYANNKAFENWNKWIAWKKSYKNSFFLFRTEPTSNPYYLNAYIINVREVTALLFTHYAVFSRELDMDFDPLEMAQDFENPDSIFWKKIFKNHLLQGILHGFGERNAYFFSKQMELGEQNTSAIFKGHLASKHSKKGAIKIPGFRSYYSILDSDPNIERYKKESIAIQKRLKGKILLHEVLDELNQAP